MTRNVFWLAIVVAMLSCGGGSNCNDLLEQMRQLQAQSNGCQKDSDCVAIQGQAYGCGSGLCGAGINVAAKDRLDAIANQYFASCNGPCAACPIAAVTMKCANGLCACGQALCN